MDTCTKVLFGIAITFIVLNLFIDYFQGDLINFDMNLYNNSKSGFVPIGNQYRQNEGWFEPDGNNMNAMYHGNYNMPAMVRKLDVVENSRAELLERYPNAKQHYKFDWAPV